MRFDKELLLKHRFWIGIAIAYPLAVIGILLLLTSVSSGIVTERKKIETDLASIKKPVGEVWNKKGIQVFEEMAHKANSKQDIVWKEAYDAQANLYKWPERIEQTYEFFDGYHANDIQILKETKADPKDWPEDSNDPRKLVMHGVIKNDKEVGPEYFYLENRQGKKIHFHRTSRLVKIDGGTQFFNALGAPANIGKVLAVSYQRGRYFNDPLSNYEQLAYTQSYRDQIMPILQQVNPLTYDERGNVKGVVQLKGWTDTSKLPESPSFFRYVETDWIKDRDISEEAWMAQEDLWIQHELYRLIKVTNEMVSKFDKVDLGQAAKPGIARFTNPYFTLDLKLQGDQLELKITNRLKRRQKLEQDFQVRFQKGKGFPETIRVSEQPLDPAGTVVNGKATDMITVHKPLDKGPTRTDIYDVEQVLTWESAAVRRIDQLIFAHQEAHGHRTCNIPLRSYSGEKAEAGPPGAIPGGPIAAAPLATPNFTAASDARGFFGGRGPGGGRGRGGLGRVGPARGSLPNGLWAERYLEVTPQARRVPVGLALIVDQDHVDRVLTTFNNSPLRFLTTQVVLNHYPGSLRPQPTLNVSPGGFPTPGLPSFANPGDTAAQDMEANIEMALYGIVTLYERFPPRPAGAAPAEETKGPPAAPKTP